MDRTFFSDSPLKLPTISAAFLIKTFTPYFSFKSRHIALARTVLPQPVGPVSKIPLGAWTPNF